MNINPVSIFNAAAFAGLLTASFALRYHTWREPLKLVAYFALFATLEIIGSMFIPEGAFGAEVGFVCLGMMLLVVTGIVVLDYLERRAS